MDCFPDAECPCDFKGCTLVVVCLSTARAHYICTSELCAVQCVEWRWTATHIPTDHEAERKPQCMYSYFDIRTCASPCSTVYTMCQVHC